MHLEPDVVAQFDAHQRYLEVGTGPAGLAIGATSVQSHPSASRSEYSWLIGIDSASLLGRASLRCHNVTTGRLIPVEVDQGSCLAPPGKLGQTPTVAHQVVQMSEMLIDRPVPRVAERNTA